MDGPVFMIRKMRYTNRASLYCVRTSLNAVSNEIQKATFSPIHQQLFLLLKRTNYGDNGWEHLFFLIRSVREKFVQVFLLFNFSCTNPVQVLIFSKISCTTGHKFSLS